MGWAANRPSEEKTVADVGRTWYTRYNIHGSYFPIHKITEPAALTRSIAVHTSHPIRQGRTRIPSSPCVNPHPRNHPARSSSHP